MKKVFQSNSELSKVFANQTQTLGRSNSMFFEHQIIYSYGYHYEIAKIVYTDKGEDIAFINSNGFSSTTAKHTNHVFRGLSDKKYFYVPFLKGYNRQYFDVNKLPEILDLMTIEIDNLLNKQIRANKSIYYLNQANDLFNKINEISELFNLSTRLKSDLFYKAENKVSILSVV